MVERIVGFVMLAILTAGCAPGAQPPATHVPSTATPPVEATLTQNAEAWLSDNSSLLISRVATELQGIEPGVETYPGTINPIYEQFKVTDIEAQLNDSTEWEVTRILPKEEHYEVWVTGNGQFLVQDPWPDDPLTKDLVNATQTRAILTLNKETLAVDAYSVTGAGIGTVRPGEPLPKMEQTE